MIISRTPCRVGFLGGGTDYPEYFREYGGVVMTTSINKYCYVGLDDGRIWSYSDLPSGCGMGTSSAFTVGLLKVCTQKQNKEISSVATFWERDKVGGNVGYQDQYICAIGGFRRLRFYGSGIVDEELNYDWLEPYLMLFDSGQYRQGSKVIAHQLQKVKENQKVLDELKVLALADYRDFIDFGNALHKAWLLKRMLSSDVSNAQIDDYYKMALEAGAIGGKLLGGGGGGFMVFVVPLDKQSDVRNSLKLNQVDFKFDKEGSQIIYDNST